MRISSLLFIIGLDIKLPVGISDFKELRNGHYDWIDKSLLIKDIIDDGSKIILYTRPRHFGKTLNMSMLYYYFASNAGDNQPLFEDLTIWQQGEAHQREQGKYPTIFITLKSFKFNNYPEAFSQFIN